MTLTLVLAVACSIALSGCSKMGGQDFSGKCVSKHVALDISRDGDSYIVKSSNPAGMGNGTFSGPYKDGQIVLGAPLFGNIRCSKEGDRLFWGGEEFHRVVAK